MSPLKLKIVVGGLATRAALKRLPLSQESVPAPLAESIRRVWGDGWTVDRIVDDILAEVASRGDEALLDLARRIDGAAPAAIVVPAEALQKARAGISPELLAALEVAAERVRRFHQECMPKSWFDLKMGLGQRIAPIAKAGVYVPGGTYASTVLHTVIPAKVAGVKNVAIASPAAKDGLPGQQVLAAAAVAGADAVIVLGGAQAIAAFAYGTASVPKVDKIFGPGGIFVTIAKKKVYGTVGIDGLYGPTETVVIADESADLALCAADLLAQAEHDAFATPVLIATSQAILSGVMAEMGMQVNSLERRDIARASIEGRGVFAVVGTVEEALDIANDFAPEHLCLLVQQPERYKDLVRNAGGLFLGEHSPEVLGDYVAGPSHTMPTGGTARFSSALGVHDFLKITSLIGLAPEEAACLAPVAAEIARAEGLTGHARALEMRATKRASVRGS